MKKHLLLIIAILIPIAVIVFYYQFYNENDTLSVQCGFYNLTGYSCPGCGGQRALHYLLHGKFLTALHYNAIFILGLPVLFYLYFVTIRVYVFKDIKYMDSFVFSSKFGYSLLAVLVIYFIIRNIPYEPFSYLSLPS